MPQIPDLLREALCHPSEEIPWECLCRQSPVSIPSLPSCPGCRAQLGSGIRAVHLPALLCHAMVFTWGHCRDATCPEELQGPALLFYSCPGVSMLLPGSLSLAAKKINTGLDESHPKPN